MFMRYQKNQVGTTFLILTDVGRGSEREREAGERKRVTEKKMGGGINEKRERKERRK